MTILKKCFRGNFRYITFPILGLICVFFLPLTILFAIIWFSHTRIQRNLFKIPIYLITYPLALLFGMAYFIALSTPPKPKINHPKATIATPNPPITSIPTPTQSPTIKPSPTIIIKRPTLTPTKKPTATNYISNSHTQTSSPEFL